MSATPTLRWERRPALAAALTILGGVFVAWGGWTLAATSTDLGRVFGLGRLYLLGEYLGGLLVVVGVVELAVPRARRTGGAIALGLAALSVPFAFGGFVAGFLLSMMGATLALLAPPVPPVAGPRSVVGRRFPPWS